ARRVAGAPAPFPAGCGWLRRSAWQAHRRCRPPGRRAAVSLARVTPVAIALGSNLGDRDATLRAALAALAPIVTGLQASSFHETTPVGVDPQPDFLNAVAVGETPLSARE